MIAVTLPIKTVSEANAHTHWRERQRRAKSQRSLAAFVLRDKLARAGFLLGHAVVTITRLAPRALDSDNLQGSQKHVRDGVADALGVKDNDARVSWAYAQEKGAPKEYAVRVEVTESW